MLIAAKIPHWANALSLDAVLVAVLWQLVFCDCFSQRLPNAAESLALALTVWLIYTADRLLDAGRVDVRYPSTFRHRFHLRHRRSLSIAWVLLLVVDAIVISTGTTPETQSMGIVVAAGVLIYGWSIHVVPMPITGLTKELQVGVLFASGVGLVSWVDIWPDASGRARWIVTWCLTSLLFTCNCLVVAMGEVSCDRAQGFISLPSFVPGSGVPNFAPFRLGMMILMILLAGCSIGLTLFDVVPGPAAVALATSSLVLVTLCDQQSKSLGTGATAAGKNSATCDGRPPNLPSGFLADASVFVPAGLCFIFG